MIVYDIFMIFWDLFYFFFGLGMGVIGDLNLWEFLDIVFMLREYWEFF